MSVLLVLLLQSASTPPIAVERIGNADDFDLARLPHAVSAPSCGEPGADGEILVCARSRDIVGLPDFSEKPLRAEIDLPGGWRGSIVGEQRSIGPGVSVPAAMVRLKLHF